MPRGARARLPARSGTPAGGRRGSADMPALLDSPGAQRTRTEDSGRSRRPSSGTGATAGRPDHPDSRRATCSVAGSPAHRLRTDHTRRRTAARSLPRARPARPAQRSCRLQVRLLRSCLRTAAAWVPPSCRRPGCHLLEVVRSYRSPSATSGFLPARPPQRRPRRARPRSPLSTARRISMPMANPSRSAAQAVSPVQGSFHCSHSSTSHSIVVPSRFEPHGSARIFFFTQTGEQSMTIGPPAPVWLGRRLGFWPTATPPALVAIKKASTAANLISNAFRWENGRARGRAGPPA
jgi:hypothetical protein